MLNHQAYAPARLIALAAGILPGDYLLEIGICTIGRSSLCHVVVRQALVSRHHAKIEHYEDMYLLSDIGSVNGTFVNGVRLTAPRQLLDRDIIGLGSRMATLQFIVPSLDLRTNLDG